MIKGSCSLALVIRKTFYSRVGGICDFSFCSSSSFSATNNMIYCFSLDLLRAVVKNFHQKSNSKSKTTFILTIITTDTMIYEKTYMYIEVPNTCNFQSRVIKDENSFI